MLLLLLAGVLPLILFVVVDVFAGPKIAIWTAMITATAAFVLISLITQTWDPSTAIEPIFIVTMGLISLRLQDPRIFKFQPAIVGICVAFLLGYFQLFDKPIMVRYLPMMAKALPAEQQEIFSDPDFIRKLGLMSGHLAILAFLHAGVMAWVALRKSNLWWILARLAVYPAILILIVIDFIVG